MDLVRIANRVDASAAQAFVSAAMHVLNAAMVEAERARPELPPGERDYERAGLSRETPGGGWISHGELRRATQEISEAIAAEKWAQGFVFALQAIAMLRP